MRFTSLVLIVTALALGGGVQAQGPAEMPPDAAVIPLWPAGTPGAVGDGAEDRPALRIVPPTAAPSGTALIICPGGSYGRLTMEREGMAVARLVASKGVAAFVLSYRLGPRYNHPSMLQDVLQAIRLVRRDAAKRGIRPDRIGVMGFSAGGHLASSAATLFDAPEGRVAGVSPDVSARPDYAVLAYPVIVMGEAMTHELSQRNLLGRSPSSALVERLSTDRQVTSATPPTFLFHTNEDTAVPAEHSIRFYLALRRAGVPAELHVYERGGHGVDLAGKDPVVRTWTERLFDWMRVRGLLP